LDTPFHVLGRHLNRQLSLEALTDPSPVPVTARPGKTEAPWMIVGLVGV
jgi:hypothetical protein